MDFVARHSQLARLGDAARERLGKNVGEGPVVIDQREERRTDRAAARDAEEVFGRGIHAGHEQGTIEHNDRGVQAFEDVAKGGFPIRRIRQTASRLVPGSGPGAQRGVGRGGRALAGFSTDVCCT